VLIVVLSSFLLFSLSYVAYRAYAQGDEELPAFANGTANTTLAGEHVNFTMVVTDNVVLNNSAGYIFSTNNTGQWENSTFNYFFGSDTKRIAWNSTVLNDTVGAVVSWKFYANDTSGNWNVSRIYNTTTDTIRTVNITVYNATGDKTGTAIKIYNSTQDLVGSGADEVVTDLILYDNYTFELTEDIDGDLLTVKVFDLNVTAEFNITSQPVKEYTGNIPGGNNKISYVISFNDTGLTYSYATVFIPNSTFGITKIFHCDDGWNYTKGECDDGSWVISDPADYDAKSNSSHTYFNVTTFDGYGGGGSVWLEVNLTLPPGDTFIQRYDVFDVNATIYCRGGSCSNVQGTVRYNDTEENPEAAISEVYGDLPLFVNESSPSNIKSCPLNPLDEDEYCNVTWKINMTGMLDSGWKVGVLLESSDTELDYNHTDNFTTTSVVCLEEITIQFSDIDFGTIFPNSVGNPAIKNPDDYFNVTNSGTCTVNMWVKSTDLVATADNSRTIVYSNLSFNNVSNDFDSSFRMNDTFSVVNSTVKRDVPSVTNVTNYFFFDLPPSFAGDYEANVTFCINSSARGTVC
jgi:hypothetical protein